ncbi:hypothetical protein C8F04DRAFT_1083840, partial [Mycena alexandri]
MHLNALFFLLFFCSLTSLGRNLPINLVQTSSSFAIPHSFRLWSTTASRSAACISYEPQRSWVRETRIPAGIVQ